MHGERPAAVTVERLDSFARSLAIVVTYIMKIEHAFEKAVFASFADLYTDRELRLDDPHDRRKRHLLRDWRELSAGRSLRLAPTPTVDSLVTSAWSDDDPPSGMFGAEAADATSYSEETFLRPSCTNCCGATARSFPGVFALANRSADMELRERREVSRLHRDEEQAIYEEVMLIDERCAKEERRKRQGSASMSANANANRPRTRARLSAARRQVKLPGGLAAASGERHQRSPKPAPQPLAAVGDVFPARAEARPR